MMLKFECECKARTFFVNKKDGMVQCISCRQRYKLENGAWVKFQVIKELSKRIDDFIYKHGVSPIQAHVIPVIETMGQWMKRHGIVKEKKKIVFKNDSEISYAEISKKSILRGSDEKKILELHIRKKWFRVIVYLLNENRVTFTKNAYNGKLRGRDAARACHSDLKKIGIETDIRWRGNGAAILELKKND